MTTAIVGTGQLGSVIARHLASGGESLRLSNADAESARALAAELGPAAVAAVDDRDAVQVADVVLLALRFSMLKSVIDEISAELAGKVVIVPSNPVALDENGNVVRVLDEGQTSGAVLAGWLPERARLAMAFGSMSSKLFDSASHRSPDPAVLFYVSDDAAAGEAAERLIRAAGFEPARVGGLDESSRLEVGGDLHDLVVGVSEAKSLLDREVPSK